MTEAKPGSTIPRGIEVLVKKASVDAGFRAMLLSSRSKAAGEIGLELDASEAAILDLVPAAQLSAIIASTRVDPLKKAAFLGKAAAVMLVALGASQAVAQVVVRDGIRKDVPVPTTQPAPGPMPTAGLNPGPGPTSQPTSKPASGPTSQPATQAAKPVPPEVIVRMPIAMAGMIARPLPERIDPEPTPVPATGPAVPDDKVAPLVKQLDADEFKDREAAQKALIDLGPGVIPHLEGILKGGKCSLEVKTRIERVLRAFQPVAPPVAPVDVGVRKGVREG